MTTKEDRIKQESFTAVFFTSLSYVLSDMRKKQKQFKIGVMTVFLVVGFVTFLDSLVQLSPTVVFMTSESSAGDFDVSISYKGAEDSLVISNSN
jgi:hypothetical protein